MIYRAVASFCFQGLKQLTSQNALGNRHFMTKADIHAVGQPATNALQTCIFVILVSSNLSELSYSSFRVPVFIYSQLASYIVRNNLASSSNYLDSQLVKTPKSRSIFTSSIHGSSPCTQLYSVSASCFCKVHHFCLLGIHLELQHSSFYTALLRNSRWGRVTTLLLELATPPLCEYKSMLECHVTMATWGEVHFFPGYKGNDLASTSAADMV